MKLLITDLRTERQWRSARGLDQKRFDKLRLLFETAYLNLFGQSIQERQDDCPKPPCLNTYTDLLFFTLFSLKSGLTFDLLGLVTGMDGSSPKRNQALGLAVLQQTLLTRGHAPKRSFRSAEEFQIYFQKHKTLIIDATEQRTQRPKGSDYQELIRAAGAVQWQKKSHTARAAPRQSHDYRHSESVYPLCEPMLGR